jgi:hypothetical protein
MQHPASGVTWHALDDAVSYDAIPLRKAPSLNAVLSALDQIIGEVESLGPDVEIPSDPEAAIGTRKKGDPDRVLGILSRFHVVAQQLRRRFDGRATIDVKDEYDAQDLLHALLKIFFDDIRTEEWTPSYAGGSSRMDFLLKTEQTVVEVKMMRKSLTTKKLGTELIEDIARYSVHGDCKSLICFVYDPNGLIGNPRGLERDLSRDERGMKVLVVVVPKGT